MKARCVTLLSGLFVVLLALPALAGPKPKLSESQLKELYKQGVELGNQGKFDDAVAKFSEAVAAEPRFWQAYLKLGQALEAQFRWPEALACYVTSVQVSDKLKAKSALPRDFLGKLYRKMGIPAMAAEAHRAALKLDSKYVRGHYELGLDLNEMKAYTEAIAEFETAIQKEPDFVRAQVTLGHTLLVVEHVNRAIDAYEKALKKAPGDVEANFGLGKALKKQDKPAEAKKYFQKACDLGMKKACKAAKGSFRQL